MFIIHLFILSCVQKHLFGSSSELRAVLGTGGVGLHAAFLEKAVPLPWDSRAWKPTTKTRIKRQVKGEIYVKKNPPVPRPSQPSVPCLLALHFANLQNSVSKARGLLEAGTDVRMTVKKLNV